MWTFTGGGWGWIIFTIGYAVTLLVVHWLFTLTAFVHFKGISHGICDGQSSTGMGFIF